VLAERMYICLIVSNSKNHVHIGPGVANPEILGEDNFTTYLI
jgi:hypothetical protein